MPHRRHYNSLIPLIIINSLRESGKWMMISRRLEEPNLDKNLLLDQELLHSKTITITNQSRIQLIILKVRKLAALINFKNHNFYMANLLVRARTIGQCKMHNSSFCGPLECQDIAEKAMMSSWASVTLNNRVRVLNLCSRLNNTWILPAIDIIKDNSIYSIKSRIIVTKTAKVLLTFKIELSHSWVKKHACEWP